MCSASTSASANRRRRHASAWTLASVHALSVALFSIHGESSDRVMPPSVSNRTSCLTSWRVNLSRTPAPKPSPSRHRMRRRLERWLRHHFQIESRRFHRPREGRGRRPTDQRPSRNPHVRPQPRRDQQQPIGPLCHSRCHARVLHHSHSCDTVPPSRRALAVSANPFARPGTCKIPAADQAGPDFCLGVAFLLWIPEFLGQLL